MRTVRSPRARDQGPARRRVVSRSRAYCRARSARGGRWLHVGGVGRRRTGRGRGSGPRRGGNGRRTGRRRRGRTRRRGGRTSLNAGHRKTTGHNAVKTRRKDHYQAHTTRLLGKSWPVSRSEHSARTGQAQGDVHEEAPRIIDDSLAHGHRDRVKTQSCTLHGESRHRHYLKEWSAGIDGYVDSQGTQAGVGDEGQVAGDRGSTVASGLAVNDNRAGILGGQVPHHRKAPGYGTRVDGSWARGRRPLGLRG